MILNCTCEKKQLTYRGMSIRFTPDLLQEIPQVKIKWSDIFQIPSGKKKLSAHNNIPSSFPSSLKMKENSSIIK